LREWEHRVPGCTDSMFAALSNVAPSLLLDRQLFDFSSLHLEKAQEGDEDAWLDQDGARV
jgi:tRNA 2-thiocytidine biosynthesis protein TtcA